MTSYVSHISYNIAVPTIKNQQKYYCGSTKSHQQYLSHKAFPLTQSRKSLAVSISGMSWSVPYVSHLWHKALRLTFSRLTQRGCVLMYGYVNLGNGIFTQYQSEDQNTFDRAFGHY